MKICYVFASRSRPYKFYQCLDNIREMSNSDNYFVWAKLDEDDKEVEKYKMGLHLYPEVCVQWGKSESKIHAINRNLEDLPPCDIIIMQSDDILWDVKGFDDEIRQAFKANWPNVDGTIHYPEDNAKNRTIIVSILGINLYKQIGYLYHPDFLSVYCDNFFTDQCRQMGKYVYINKRLFTHAHPIFKLTSWDQQYRDTESKENYRVDRETYIRLRKEILGL